MAGLAHDPWLLGSPAFPKLTALCLCERDVYTDHIAVLMIIATNRRHPVVLSRLAASNSQEPSLPVWFRG